jgi:hypothetical protein
MATGTAGVGGTSNNAGACDPWPGTEFGASLLMLPYLTCTPPKHPEISVQSGVEIEKFTGSMPNDK